MILLTAAMQYGYGWGFGRGSIFQLLLGIFLVFVGITGIFNRSGKYDNRSFFEMNAAYLFALLAGIALLAMYIRNASPFA